MGGEQASRLLAPSESPFSQPAGLIYARMATSCLHSVNAAGVRLDGEFDQKTIADALFIAQYLVGLRDEFYSPMP